MPMKNPPHPDVVSEPRVLNPWPCPSRRERRSSASPGKRSTTSSTASRDQPPDGDPALKGVRQHGGNVVTDAACL